MDPIAPIAAVAASRPLPGEAGGLTPGAVVRARVAGVAGGMVRLQWGGDQTVSVPSTVPLSVGQEVSLLVQGGAAGTTVLRMVDAAMGRGQATQATNRPGRPDVPTGGHAVHPSDVAAGNGSLAGRDNAAGRGDRPWGGRQASAPLAAGSALPARNEMVPSGPLGSIPLGAATSGFAPAADRALAPMSAADGGPVPATGSGDTPADGSPTGGKSLAAERSTPVHVASRAAGAPRPSLLPPTPLPPTALASWTRSIPSRAGALLSPDTAGTGLPVTVSGEASTSLSLVRPPIDVPAYGRLIQLVDSSRQRPQVLVPTPPALPSQPRADGTSFLMIDTPALLDQLGLAPGRLNTALVSQLVAQGAPLSEAVVRRLRQALARLGGSPDDAGAAVLLSRLGLPVSVGTLEVARRVIAGRHDPAGAWRDALGELQALTESAPELYALGNTQTRDPARTAAREVLQRWTPNNHHDGPALARWLRSAVEGVATPPESRVAESEDVYDAARDGRDARTEVSELRQELARSPHAGAGTATRAVERLEMALLAEQTLNAANAAPTDRGDPRTLAVTIPIVRDGEPGAIELTVRERDRHTGEDGQQPRPDVAHIKLDLPALGELRVNLTVTGSRVACRFEAETPFADALLRASVGDLSTRLERLGYREPAITSTSTPADDPESADGPATLVARRVRRVDFKA